MSRLTLLAGACTVLAGCNFGAPGDSGPASVCTAMLDGDAEVSEDLADDGWTLDDYCGCFATVLESESGDNRATILKVSRVIADIREEKGVDVEDAAESLMTELMASGAGTGATPTTRGMTQSDFESTGNYVEKIRRDLKSGACSAA